MKRTLALFLLALCLNGCTLLPKKHPYDKKPRVAISQQALRSRYFQNAKREIDKDIKELLAQDEEEKARWSRLNKFFGGDRRDNWVALTFDDGPHPAFTMEILKVLKEQNVKATFFLVGNMAENYPELVKAEVIAGHSIGNHTYDHVSLTKVTTADAGAEIKACGDVLEAITGRRPYLFRPPGGDYDRNVALMAKGLGYTLVLWSDSAGDWSGPDVRTIEKRLLGNLQGGTVVLLHDGIKQTLDILPELIASIKRRGYRFVTIDEVLPAGARVSR
ncbi:MAG TPA: polysaccharide deacetylase family protein, partial [Candidatus Sulfotelmatobacter sp.]|nr:polysaccharide deacetylase family protein [Candidatus Sulfotelmatobacter sp.]